MIMRSSEPPSVIEFRVMNTHLKLRIRPAEDLILEADIFDKKMPLIKHPRRKLTDPSPVCSKIFPLK